MEVTEKAYVGPDRVRIVSAITSEKLLPHLRVAAEFRGGASVGIAHVARDNIGSIKSEK